MAPALEPSPALAALPDPMWPRPFRVQHVRRETPDTFTLELEPAAGVEPSSFSAGQFNMLSVFGVGEAAISISGDPGRPHWLTHTTRMVGNVTKAMGKLRRGSTLGVRGPYGSSWPLADATGRDVVLVAGGIGLAPLRPALYHLVAHRDQYGKVVLLYGVRTPEDMLYRPQLEKWRGAFDLELHVTVDRATGNWRGNVGVVTTLIPRAPFDPLNTVAMVCGPEVMMRYAVRELERRGLNGKNIFVSLERNMKCGVGFCGHCQFGPKFICKDGPVFAHEQVSDLLGLWEL